METLVIILTCSVGNRWLREKQRVTFWSVSRAPFAYSECCITHSLLRKNVFLYQLWHTNVEKRFLTS